MNSTQAKATRKKMVEKGAKLRVTWDTYHDLGVQINESGLLPVNMSLEAIAKELGTTKQRMYHEYIIALGKVAYRIREAVQHGGRND